VPTAGITQALEFDGFDCRDGAFELLHPRMLAPSYDLIDGVYGAVVRFNRTDFALEEFALSQHLKAVGLCDYTAWRAPNSQTGQTQVDFPSPRGDKAALLMQTTLLRCLDDVRGEWHRRMSQMACVTPFERASGFLKRSIYELVDLLDDKGWGPTAIFEALNVSQARRAPGVFRAMIDYVAEENISRE